MPQAPYVENRIDGSGRSRAYLVVEAIAIAPNDVDVTVSDSSGHLSAGTSSVTGPTGCVRLEDYGTVDLTGLTNSNAAMLAAVTAAKTSLQTLPYSVQSGNPSGAIQILLPAGNILITADKGMMGLEGMVTTGNGIKFQGAGKGITNIIFKPSVAGSLMEVDRWYNVQFEGISFHAATTGCTCFFGNTTHSAQRYRFHEVSWNLFKYDIRLAGNNNNSEIAVTDWDSTNVEAAGAHFYTAAGDASDQFLNYWWTNGTFWLTDAPMIDSAKGGHYVVENLDASAWGAGLGAAGKLFYLRGTSHSSGVCSFKANLRGEFTSANAGLIYSEWPYGNVDIDCDASPLIGTYTYGAGFIYIYYDQTDGPAYRFTGILAGGITVSHGNDYAHQHRILVDEATWAQKESPSDVVTYEESRVSFGTVTRPPVEFRRCRPFPGSYTDAFGATGVAIWDCTIGYLGEAVQSTRRREVRIGGGFGAPATTEVITVLLPVGALITSFEGISPSGASAEADGGTWTLVTSDGSPVTIGTVVVSGAMSAGFNLTTPLTLPFLCSTTAKARVTVTCTSVATANTKAMLFIKGYW